MKGLMQDRRIHIVIGIFALVLLGCTCALPATQLPTPTSTPIPTIAIATPPLLLTPVLQESGSRVLLTQEQLVIDIYRRASPAVVYIEVRQGAAPDEGGSGAGFVYDMEGHVVTNAHVVRDAQEIWVYFSDDTAVSAQILGADSDADLAVLKVDVPKEILMPLEMGTSAGLEVGQLAIAIGNPYGYERTLTVGFISALGRVLVQESLFSVAEVIQTDAAINPGNSGGPLLDSAGKVIGVNSYYRPSNPLGGSVGIGFAIPVDLVKLVVPELITHGRYRHPWLGITGYQIHPQLAEALDLPTTQGALVTEVIEGSPAARSGVRGGVDPVQVPGYPAEVEILSGGDIIVAIDSIQVHGMDDIITYLQKTIVGQKVVLKIIRDGKEMEVSVELGERPPR